MKLYLVFGDHEGLYGEEFRYFYGCFSTKEKADVIRKNLEESPNGDGKELFLVEEYTLNDPTELYHFMTEK